MAQPVDEGALDVAGVGDALGVTPVLGHGSSLRRLHAASAVLAPVGAS